MTIPARYRQDRLIAAGGMAAVYAAHDTVLDRPVAVKVMAEHLGLDDAARLRFQREARAAAGLSSHPNVVTIFDVGEHDGRSFMVMERMAGGTVADRLRHGAPDRETALRWLRDTAAGLDAAHERGIVHRDIKPANLLLNEKGDAAVADFGIARLAEEDAITATGTVLGTAAYISPEQAQGHSATAASDRYSLGVVAFELLTGRRPFEAENFAAQARAQIEDPPPRPSDVDRTLPPAVDAVLARALAKDPAERWLTATEFVGALEVALERPATATTLPLEGGRFPRTIAAPPPLARRRRGYGPLLALAGGLLLIALGALALALTGGGDETPPPAADRTQPEERAPAKQKPSPTAEPEQPAAVAQPEGENPTQLNDQGYELFEAGRYEEAIPYFEKAVEQCGDSKDVNPCAFALYNLGASLRRAGQPAEAIPVLQERLERFDNQEGVVMQELAAACDEAGVECPGLTGNGKGSKPKKDKDD